MATNARRPAYASTRPTTLPAAPKTRLSTSNSLAIRPGIAPSAARTANSGRRASARTSMRFAMLAQAISSTAPIAPMSTHNMLDTPPTKSSNSGCTTAAEPPVRELLCRHPRKEGPSVDPDRPNAVEVRLRFGQRHARLQPGEHLPRVDPVGLPRRVHAHGNDDVGLLRPIKELEPGRHDAHDLRGRRQRHRAGAAGRVHRKLAPERRFVTAESPLPKPIRKNHGRRPVGAGVVVSSREPTSAHAVARRAPAASRP